MEMLCAGCGCLVERGVRVVVCDDPNCCCQQVPVRKESGLQSGASGHYAEAFTTVPGQCFRFVHAGTGHAQHCPNTVVRTGQFTDAKGKRWTVDACAEHSDDLVDG
jgi:hypothetical protein